MPEFTVPQFIEREPKLIGPFTFKQFMFVATAGGTCFFLYFIYGKKNLPLFIVVAIILMGVSLVLSFLKIKGYTLPTLIKNLFMYTLSSKIFIWKRKIAPPKFKKIEKFEKEEPEEKTTLKMAKRGHLQQLSTDVQTKKTR